MSNLPPPPPSYFKDQKVSAESAISCLSLILLFGFVILAWRLSKWMYLRFPLGFGIILAIWATILIQSPDDGGIDSAAFAPWMYLAAVGCGVWQVVKWRGAFE
jgi:hypothetical protein